MGYNYKRLKLSRCGTGIAALLVIAAVSVILLAQHSRTEAAPKAGPSAGTMSSQFKFTGTPGWWQGATNQASMALFHTSDSCFVSVEHKTGTVDMAADLQKEQTTLTDQGYAVTTGNVQMLNLQTATGSKQYELHEFAVTTPAGAQKVMGGQEFGYLQLTNGYLKIMGYCDTADELASTISALQAIKFDE